MILPLFSEIWTDLLEPAAGENFGHFWSVSKGEIVVFFLNFWGPPGKLSRMIREPAAGEIF